ncbi:uncharacterized protein [Rutidosis leptorrhynchoides]|uniref:uncharacterized protein n=1 Tax=Rutidosis leptorrhynchoides TaxID=125765 RepID=UPI003A99F3D6
MLQILQLMHPLGFDQQNHCAAQPTVSAHSAARYSTQFNWAWAANPKWRVASNLISLTTLVNDISCTEKEYDEWIWKYCNRNIYSSKSLVNLLTEFEIGHSTSLTPTRASQNKLPVRTELDARGIDLHSTRCLVCDNDIETLRHLLLNCNTAKDIWERIRKWWNLDHLNLNNITDIAKAHHPSFSTHTGSQIWQAIVWITCYYIWKNRNDLTFGKSKACRPKIISDLQEQSFIWLRNRGNKLNLEWLSWMSNPPIFDVNPVDRDGIG